MAETERFLSTYAKLFIGFSEPISGLVKQYSRQSQSKTTEVLGITRVTADQINQTLSHPQNKALKVLVGTAYTGSIETTREITKAQEDLEEQRIFLDETIKQLTTRKQKSPTKNLDATISALSQQLKILAGGGLEGTANTIQKSLNDVNRQLEEVDKDLGELSKKHDIERANFRDNMLPTLIEEVKNVAREAGLPPIPEGEIDNMRRQDFQAVHDRFIDLGANKDLPPAQLEKILNLKNPDFDTDFKMRAYMALRSVNPPLEKRAGLMKLLENIFQTVKNLAQPLFDKQAAEIRAINQQRVQPLLQVAKQKQDELAALKADRARLLKTVPKQELETIQEITEQRIADIKPTTPRPT